jgi:hypothetical protein
MKLSKKFAVLLLLLVPVIAFALPVSFCISNNSTRTLGEVKLHYSGGQTVITVGGRGNWVTTTPSNVTGVTVFGQRTDFPHSKTISTPTGAKIRISWNTTNLIEVIDLATQG